jgi:hypothetical protein
MVSGTEIHEFKIEVPESALADLRDRLIRTRWPVQLPNQGWHGGPPVDRIHELAERWRTGFDWRDLEARLNDLPQFTTVVDGQTIHFLWLRSPRPNAFPLLATHGWPGSFLEFVDLAGLLVDHDEAFDLVVPSIPGFGFSSPLHGPGWHGERVAYAWTVVMERLGYARYGVHGGDLGAGISRRVGRLAPGAVAGIHVNYLPTPPIDTTEDLPPADTARLAAYQAWSAEYGAYEHLQRTRPQSLSYGLTDSPTGLLAWITERFHDWTDPHLHRISDDILLADVSLYWLTGTAGSAAQYYLANAAGPPVTGRGTVPTGVSCFPHEIVLPVRTLADRIENITWWRDHHQGGHFPALEVPQTLCDDLRDFFRPLRRLRAPTCGAVGGTRWNASMNKTSREAP